MIVSIIVAVDKNNLIGAKGTLPWHIPEDLQRFKEITMGHAVIMGRKTYESIGRPLPGRTMVVISKTMKSQEGISVFSSLNKAISALQGDAEVFVIGGARVFLEALPIANKLYLTRIDHVFAGDVYFPNVTWNDWEEISKKSLVLSSTDAYSVDLLTFSRKQVR